MDVYGNVWICMHEYGSVWIRMENHQVHRENVSSFAHWFCSWWIRSCQYVLPSLLYLFWKAGSGPIKTIPYHHCMDPYGTVQGKRAYCMDPYGSVWDRRMEPYEPEIRMDPYGSVWMRMVYGSIRIHTKTPLINLLMLTATGHAVTALSR